LQPLLKYDTILPLLGRSERSGGFRYFDEYKPDKYQIRIGYNLGIPEDKLHAGALRRYVERLGGYAVCRV